MTPYRNEHHLKDSKQVKIDYRGWTIQLIDHNNLWQTQITSPDGMTSGLSNLVGIHQEIEGIITSARNYIDKRLTWQLIKNFLESANQQNLISWQEWENLSASLTCWAIHDD